MSEETPDDAPAIQGEVLNLGRRLLGSQALQVLLFGVVCILAYRAIAQDAGAHTEEKLAPVVARVAQLEQQSTAQAAATAAVQRDLTDVRTQGQETALNVRLLLQAQGLKPIVLVAPPRVTACYDVCDREVPSGGGSVCVASHQVCRDGGAP